MLRARHSPQVKGNSAVKVQRKTRAETNTKWIARAEEALTPGLAKVLLLGGTELADFRVRVAQSDARRDMKPSFWSHAALSLSGTGRSKPSLYHVPLEVGDDLSAVPRTNGIRQTPITFCSDKDRWQNLALLEFHGAPRTEASRCAKRIQKERLSFDLVSSIVEWLGFVWGNGDAGNPLHAGVPLPSAAFVEAVFANCDIDLVPGMADRTHCPEAIWQAAKWWSDFYAGDEDEDEGVGVGVPQGRFVIGQGEAAVRED